MSIRTFQVAVRSYQNIYGYRESTLHPMQAGTTDIVEHLLRKDFITSVQYAQATGTKACPGGGFYERGDPSLFPPTGQPYLTCSLAPEPDSHRPTKTGDW